LTCSKKSLEVWLLFMLLIIYTLLDIEKDNKVCDVQIPELRSNLTKSRSLLDPLIYTGHTTSYHKHTLYWYFTVLNLRSNKFKAKFKPNF
jgi:hypothetical protein